MLEDPGTLRAITEQRAQGRQRLGAGLGPTYAAALLALGGGLVVGTFDRVATVALAKSVSQRIARDRVLIAMEVVLEPRPPHWQAGWMRPCITLRCTVFSYRLDNEERLTFSAALAAFGCVKGTTVAYYRRNLLLVEAILAQKFCRVFA